MTAMQQLHCTHISVQSGMQVYAGMRVDDDRTSGCTSKLGVQTRMPWSRPDSRQRAACARSCLSLTALSHPPHTQKESLSS